MKFIPYITIICLILSLSGSLFVVRESSSKQNVDWRVKIKQSGEYSVEIYSGEDTYIGTIGFEKKFYSKFKSIPKRVIQAFISAEDKDFYKHSGFSLSGILRAAAKNLLNLGYRQGASTITQQLVRDVEKDKERTIQRKIREIFNAVNLEKEISKNEILESYLNRIYLGYAYYGVASAAQGYFGKKLDDLTLSEISLLAAIVSAPSRYKLHSQSGLRKALKQRKYVLRRMSEDGYVSDMEVTRANKDVPRVLSYSSRQEFGEILSLVADELKRKGLWNLKSKKMKVYLSIKDSKQRAYKNYLKKWSKNFEGGLEFSLISIQKKSSKIESIIGSRNFRLSKFNRAIKTKRPIGNMITYLIYGAAYEFSRELPWLKNVPGNTWTSKLDGHTMLSNYYIANIGMGTVSDFFKRLGWASPPQDFSIALGREAHSLQELTSYFVAYGKGRPAKTSLISKIIVDEEKMFVDEGEDSFEPSYSLAMKNIMMGLKPDWLPISYKFPAAVSFSDNNRNAWSVIDLGHSFLGIWMGIEDGVSRFSEESVKKHLSTIYTDLTNGEGRQSLMTEPSHMGLNFYWHPKLSTRRRDVFLPHLGKGVRLEQGRGQIPL